MFLKILFYEDYPLLSEKFQIHQRPIEHLYLASFGFQKLSMASGNIFKWLQRALIAFNGSKELFVTTRNYFYFSNY